MKQRALFTLAILFAVNTLNFFDRQVLGAVGEVVRREFGFGDTALGALGTAFTLLYAVVGVPFGRMADRFPRKTLAAVLFAASRTVTDEVNTLRTWMHDPANAQQSGT